MKQKEKTTLKKLLEQDAFVANETIKLNKLKEQYVHENRKFLKGDIVVFDNSGISKLGKIERAKYFECKSLIRYTIRIIKKDGSYSKSDTSFYNKMEHELKNA